MRSFPSSILPSISWSLDLSQFFRCSPPYCPDGCLGMPFQEVQGDTELWASYDDTHSVGEEIAAVSLLAPVSWCDFMTDLLCIFVRRTGCDIMHVLCSRRFSACIWFNSDGRLSCLTWLGSCRNASWSYFCGFLVSIITWAADGW